MPVTWQVLEVRGWKTRLHPVTNRLSYIRPSGGIVNAKRDLSEQEKQEIGDILFPFSNQKGKRGRVSTGPELVTDTVATLSPGPAPAQTALPVSESPSSVSDTSSTLTPGPAPAQTDSTSSVSDTFATLSPAPAPTHTTLHISDSPSSLPRSHSIT